MERVKAQILAGLRREAKEPNAIARNAFAAAAFPDHPYGAPPKGTLDSVPRITRDDLEAYRRKSFARDGLKIAVVGDIDERTLVEALDRVFADLPSRAELAPVEDRVMRGGEERKIDLPVPQSVIVFGLPGLARKDKDYVPAVVMNHILGGGSFTSRLWTEVREKRGLAYSVYSSLSPFKHGPILAGATSTKNERARESIAVITAEIDELSRRQCLRRRARQGEEIPHRLLRAQIRHLDQDRARASPGAARRSRHGLLQPPQRRDRRRRCRRYREGGEAALDTKRMLVVVVGQPVG